MCITLRTNINRKNPIAPKNIKIWPISNVLHHAIFNTLRDPESYKIPYHSDKSHDSTYQSHEEIIDRYEHVTD